LFVMLPFILKI